MGCSSCKQWTKQVAANQRYKGALRNFKRACSLIDQQRNNVNRDNYTGYMILKVDFVSPALVDLEDIKQQLLNELPPLPEQEIINQQKHHHSNKL
ncbi:hypothetical protein UY3_08329 [Chelonia mydas]|uniref:Uncharacterized protein n=1 Tax=Chelonia mydas TaxID=8469 RepID=M7BFW4_CHEMY|nr:hypothetical protein UY3_08329 [Chelonia mydas]